MDNIYLLDEFAAVKEGQPFRLFPFGKIVKNGKVRLVTPELAAKFKIPHFSPPIKLGSHKEETPAGGFIKSLLVKEDGLYAIPEWNEEGESAIEKGSYRYNSPEVIWEGGGFEDPQTGEIISAPLVVGTALLHNPHLGKQAALYKVTKIKEDEKMTDTVTIPVSTWDKFMSLFTPGAQPPSGEKETKGEADSELIDKFAALQDSHDKLVSKLAEVEAERTKVARVEKFAAALGEEKDSEIVEILIGLEDETADKLVTRFKALTAQIKESEILGEKGTDGDGSSGDSGADDFDTAVKKYAAEKKINYFEAVGTVAKANPELFEAYRNGGK